MEAIAALRTIVRRDNGESNRQRLTRMAKESGVATPTIAAVGLALTSEDPCDPVADEGYHSREGLKEVDGGPWKTRIAEPKRVGIAPMRRAAVYGNRGRLKSEVAKGAMRKRGEMVERSFVHIPDRGGMRRAWLRGRQNVHKRYLIHVAGSTSAF